jgi:hypothetical protein
VAFSHIGVKWIYREQWPSCSKTSLYPTFSSQFLRKRSKMHNFESDFISSFDKCSCSRNCIVWSGYIIIISSNGRIVRLFSSPMVYSTKRFLQSVFWSRRILISSVSFVVGMGKAGRSFGGPEDWVAK